MSSESDYLLKPVPTNATMENKPILSSGDGLLNTAKQYWISFIQVIGKQYIAEFLATFILMVS